MNIRVECPNCGAAFKAPAEARGRRAKCRKCGEAFTLSAVPEVYALARGDSRHDPHRSVSAADTNDPRQGEPARTVPLDRNLGCVNLVPFVIGWGGMLAIVAFTWAGIAGWLGPGVQRFIGMGRGAPIWAAAGLVTGLGKTLASRWVQYRQEAGEQAVRRCLGGTLPGDESDHIIQLVRGTTRSNVHAAAAVRLRAVASNRCAAAAALADAYTRCRNAREGSVILETLLQWPETDTQAAPALLEALSRRQGGQVLRRRVLELGTPGTSHARQLALQKLGFWLACVGCLLSLVPVHGLMLSIAAVVSIKRGKGGSLSQCVAGLGMAVGIMSTIGGLVVLMS